MKQLKLNGLQIVLLRSVITRPTTGAGIDTFIKIMRVYEKMYFNKKDINTIDTFEIELEDADYDFIKEEWADATKDREFFARQITGIDQMFYMQNIIDLNRILK